MDWQPIETAPKDGTAVIVYGGNDEANGKLQVGQGFWDSYVCMVSGTMMRWCWENGAVPCDPQPTHWMPLPKPPRARATTPHPPDTPEKGA